MLAQANVARKKFDSKFTAEIGFRIGHYITIADADILHTLFVKHLDHILINFEQKHLSELNKF